MASRPKSTSPRFDLIHVSVAGDVSRREIIYLKETAEGLLPPGRGTSVVKRAATIGAFKSAGMTLLPAARLAKELSYTYGDRDGDTEAPSRFSDIAGAAMHSVIKPEWDLVDLDYHLHRELWNGALPGYRPGQATAHDWIVEIVNGRTVLTYMQ
jgi:hypothetical protein